MSPATAASGPVVVRPAMAMIRAGSNAMSNSVSSAVTTPIDRANSMKKIQAK